MSAPGARALGVALLLVPASASADAGTGTRAPGSRPPVALVASPSRISLAGAGRATVRITNAGTRPVVVDVTRAGFALDLRGRPKIVGAVEQRSAARWLTSRPRSVAIRPGGTGTVAVVSRLPPRAEPGDHDALLLLSTRRRVRDGVAVRMRMGVVVVVRVPGAVVHRVVPGALRAARPVRGRARAIELLLANQGNVTESIVRARASLSLFSRSRRIAKLSAVPRELRPRTRGLVQFLYRGRARGPMTARVDISLDGSGRTLQRVFRIRM